MGLDINSIYLNIFLFSKILKSKEDGEKSDLKSAFGHFSEGNGCYYRIFCN